MPAAAKNQVAAKIGAAIEAEYLAAAKIIF
jgi:hypothetical protein